MCVCPPPLPCRRDDEETLTALGHALASLPMSPQLGKMVMYGVLLGCVDPALTLACAMAYRSPFLLPMNEFEKAQVCAALCVYVVPLLRSLPFPPARVCVRQAARARSLLCQGVPSDHIALIAAYNGYANAVKRGGQGTLWGVIVAARAVIVCSCDRCIVPLQLLRSAM